LLFDIPLLFETGGDRAFETIIVVSAPADVQRERVLARPGMTDEKLTHILARQTPDAEKRAKAPTSSIHPSAWPRPSAKWMSSLLDWDSRWRIASPMREIVFDTETTGVNPATGDGWSRSAAWS
jgi:hypothetical protein